MLLHSYGVDSLSKSQDLASTILSSSSPSQISSTCASIDSFLHLHSPDQSRHFFSIAFPSLICKIFGLDDATSSSTRPNTNTSSCGWIDTVLASNDADLANRVFSLLSPNGTLMSSIAAIDRISLVKYVFPAERLPEWVRFMLSNDKDGRALSDLCLLFNGKVKEDSTKASFQIQLNVFEYYMFWFAYYPVCRGSSQNSNRASVKSSGKFRLEKWTYSIPGFSSVKRGPEQKIECNLYLRLLYAYLRAFVPAYDLNAHQPYRSSLLHYASEYDGSVMMRAEFLVSTLVHYWLIDNDFSPLPVNVGKSFGVLIPFPLVFGETPPAFGLGEVVKLFVKYLNLSSVAVTQRSDVNVEYNESPGRRSSSFYDSPKSRELKSVSSCVRPAASWNTMIQRSLYRFLLRSFLFFPVATPIKNAYQVFDVWISYMEPWMINSDEFAALDAVVDGAALNGNKEETRSLACGYTLAWQGYVLANYLYYNSLVMHFIGFAHKFLHSDVETIVRMVMKMMDTLTSSKELIELLKNVDSAFHSKQHGSNKSLLNKLYRYVPSIRELLKDWENGICESDTNGSFLHDNWNKDLRLFSDGEAGGQQLLQLFILRAEAELQAISGDDAGNNLQFIDLLKERVGRLFDGQNVELISLSPLSEPCQKSRDEIFKPRRANHVMANIKYKGDWMERPISNDEVAWLAKLLVRFSAWLNERLGLNQAESSPTGPAWSYVEVPSDVSGVYALLDVLKVVIFAIGTWLLFLGACAIKQMRKYGARVNLRVLASKKVVMVFVLYAVYNVLKKVVGRS